MGEINLLLLLNNKSMQFGTSEIYWKIWSYCPVEMGFGNVFMQTTKFYNIDVFHFRKQQK